MKNRYLQDRASRRYNSRGMRMSDRAMDGRNPYGSRGGYVMSTRRGRGRDRAMDDRNYYPEYDSRGNRGYDREQYDSDYHYGSQHYGEHNRPMDYEMYAYGVGGMRPMYDYDMRGRRDYGMDYGMDYASGDMEKEWEKHLEEWCKELKKKDKFGLPKEQVLSQAKQMGIKMNKDYSEEEFITTYYMVISDDKHNLLSNPQIAMYKAVDFLEDDDAELQGSEKLCAYYYEIVKGGKED